MYYSYDVTTPTKIENVAEYKERIQTLEERAFNAMCKQNGVNAIYEFYFYTKFGGGLMKLLNSENKNKGVRLKDPNGRELCCYETTSE